MAKDNENKSTAEQLRELTESKKISLEKEKKVEVDRLKKEVDELIERINNEAPAIVENIINDIKNELDRGNLIDECTYTHSREEHLNKPSRVALETADFFMNLLRKEGLSCEKKIGYEESYNTYSESFGSNYQSPRSFIEILIRW